jgi:hypothetical protein
VLGEVVEFELHLGCRQAWPFAVRSARTLSTPRSIAASGMSSGRTRIGVWQLRTKSRVTVYTKSRTRSIFSIAPSCEPIRISASTGLAAGTLFNPLAGYI